MFIIWFLNWTAMVTVEEGGDRQDRQSGLSAAQITMGATECA